MAYTLNQTRFHYFPRVYQSHSKGRVRDDAVGSYEFKRSGTAVRGHRAIIGSGSNASSPFSRTDTSFDVPSTTWSVNFRLKSPPYTAYSDSLVGTPGGAFYPWEAQTINSITARMESDALSQMYSRIRSNRSDINGFAFLGELRETLKMLRKPLASLTTQVYKHLERTVPYHLRAKKNLRYKKSHEWSDAVSGTALEINFGWKPVISDIQAIAKIAAKVVTNENRRKSFRTQSESQTSSYFYDGFWSARAPATDCWLDGIQTREQFDTGSVKVTAGVNLREECAESALQQVIRLSGFTTENILPAAYELTPWSWLADYFSNLGDLIEAGTTDVSDVAYWCITKANSRKTVRTVTGLPWTNASYEITSISQPVHRQVHVCTSAERLIFSPGSLPLPKFYLTHPLSSVSRVVNLLSVLDQRRPRIS